MQRLILLCNADYYRTKVFGKVKNNSIYEIHGSEEFTEARKEITKGNPIYDIFKNCNYFV